MTAQANTQITRGNLMSWTGLPDRFIDEDNLNVYELACVVFINRKTQGWGKRKDGISNSQFAKALSISKNTVIKSLKSLEEKGIIVIETSKNDNGSQTYNHYSFTEEVLNSLMEPSVDGVHLMHPPVHEMNRGGSRDEQGGVHEMNTQEKPNTKQTKQDLKDIYAKEDLELEIIREHRLCIPSHLPEGLTAEVVEEFIQHRFNLEKPLSQQSLTRAISESYRIATELKTDGDKVLHEAIDAGWATFKLEWLKKRFSSEKKQYASAHSGFAERAADHFGINADGSF